MTYFIAWVVIGVCCYYIGKNRRDRYLPKYHTGMLFLQKNDDLGEPATPENVARWSKILENVILVITILIAPISLLLSIKRLFYKGPGEGILKMKSCCDEFVKRHGIVF